LSESRLSGIFSATRLKRGGRLQIRLERINSHIEITVSNTGQGFSREFLPYVFDRFRQAEAGTEVWILRKGIGCKISRGHEVLP
jgi:signal transduction histidine kinase